MSEAARRLTLLIHLGYLAYNEMTKKAYIPNEEIRQEFARTVRRGRGRIGAK